MRDSVDSTGERKETFFFVLQSAPHALRSYLEKLVQLLFRRDFEISQSAVAAAAIIHPLFERRISFGGRNEEVEIGQVVRDRLAHNGQQGTARHGTVEPVAHLSPVACALVCKMVVGHVCRRCLRVDRGARHGMASAFKNHQIVAGGMVEENVADSCGAGLVGLVVGHAVCGGDAVGLLRVDGIQFIDAELEVLQRCCTRRRLKQTMVGRRCAADECASCRG